MKTNYFPISRVCFHNHYTINSAVYNRGMIELQRCTRQEVWDDYVLDNGGHPLQLWGWGQVKSAHGWVADRVLGYDDEKIVAAAQILTKKVPLPFRAISYVPRGPLGEQGTSEEFLTALGNFTKREHHSVALTIEPDSAEFPLYSSWKKSQNAILPSSTVALDLEKSESDLLATMAKKTRQYIRKSAAEKITIKTVRSRLDLEKCLEVYHQTSDRAGFGLHGDQYYLDVFSLMGDHSPVFAAYVDDQPVAFLWLAVSLDTSYELYGGMNEQGAELRANYALKWHAIRKTKEWGLKNYDFGGLIEDGVSNFKRSWTDHDTVLAGTFDMPLSSAYGLWASALPRGKKVVQKLKSLRK